MNPKSGLQRGGEVLNLSKHFTPSTGQLRLLNKGLSFVPTPKINLDMKKRLTLDVQQYHRRLLLSTYFRYEEDSEPPLFTHKSNWTPKLSQVPNTVRKIIRADRYAIRNLPWGVGETPNLDREERRALAQLSQDRSIVIKPADKGSVTVIMDRGAYIKEAERQLHQEDYYRKLTEPIFHKTIPEVRELLTQLRERGFINKKQEAYLMGPDNPRQRCFYLLPKIHKDPQSWSVPFEMPPGRPIVSDCDSETYGTAQYIEYFLNPISTRHPSYIKDTYDFISKIRELTLPPDCFLFTIDIDSLYTNIETPAGLEAVTEWFSRYPNKNRPDSILLKLLEINLNKNDFEFDTKFYLQVKGTAMGKRFAPSYANIFMARWEERALAAWHTRPLHYFRFLDDIWGVWSGTEGEFEQFAAHLNRFDRSIKIKYTLHQTEVNFLDTVTYKGRDFPHTHRLDIRVYFKETDTHALLFKTSYHPKHTFRGIVKSQLLRFQRICSQPGEFWDAKSVLFRALRQRGYSRSFLRSCLRSFRTKREPNGAEMIPLITTFSKASVLLNRNLKENFDRFMSVDGVLDHHRVISAYRKNPNLGDLLVRSRLPQLRRPKKKPSPVTEYRPKRWISNPRTKDLFPIWPPIPLEVSNCVYLIYCIKCHMQYVGETRNTIATRMWTHRYNIIHHKYTHTPLVQHFIKHGIHSLRVMGLQHHALWSHTTRKRTEREWIARLGSVHPWGLNDQPGAT